MALPYWERLTKTHAALLDAEGLRLWLAILAHAGPGGQFPVSRFFFLPNETHSSFSCMEGGGHDTGFAEISVAHAQLQGEWLGEFDRGIVLSLGQGTMQLDIVEDRDEASGFGQAQRGYIEFGQSLYARGYMTKASASRFFELTGQTLLSDGAMLELSSMWILNDLDDALGSLMYGPRDALAYGKVALSAPRTRATLAPGRPALQLHGFGARKVAVVSLLMRDLGLSAGEAAQRAGRLEQPLQVAVAPPGELESILDMADDYIAAGATVRFAVLPLTEDA